MSEFPARCAIVVLTKNEADNLIACLNAVPPELDRIVVDSGSTDGTVDLARSLGCEVIERTWDGFAGQRNYALQSLRDRYDWILFIDADEIYSVRFFDWMRTFIASSEPTEVVDVSSRIVLDGKRLRYAPGYPIYHPRLVKTDRSLFVENRSNHGETVLSDAVVRRVDIPYDHYSIGHDLRPWLEKHIRLAEMEVRESTPRKTGRLTMRARLNSLLATGLARAIARFIYHYIVRLGFLDGSAGYRYAAMYAWYEQTKWLLSTGRRHD